MTSFVLTTYKLKTPAVFIETKIAFGGRNVGHNINRLEKKCWYVLCVRTLHCLVLISKAII